MTSFFAGALSVLIVLPLQRVAQGALGGILLLLVWALIEEGIKFCTALLVDFRNKAYDEPLDAMIYLITVALGFAAFENVLFAIKSFASGGITVSLVTVLMRFLGATLLHVLVSATLGGFIAMAFYSRLGKKVLYASLGLIVATILHTAFNFFILNEVSSSGNGNIFVVFAGLWTGIILLLLFFEKVKTITIKNI